MSARLIACYAAACVALIAQPQDRKDDKLRRELGSAFRAWIEQDVAYIITDSERKAFNGLQNDEEREQFIEQFWLRRDPTPDTTENEFREEHYRRIAYANERFGSGVSGWKTDRGRAYIVYGPPDEIESHPSGGTYQRPPEQGGGSTQTYPFETWRYRYIEGIGTDVAVEFVDSTLTGEYKLAFDPAEKDALTHVTPGLPPQTALARAQPLDRVDRWAAFQRTPSIPLKDLEALVSSSIKYNTVPMKVRADFLRMTDSTVLSPITIQFDHRQRATLNVYMRVTTLAGRVIAAEENVITFDGAATNAVYQKMFVLPPGNYRLNVVVKDAVGGGTGSEEIALHVPQFESGKLAASSMILADLIEKVPARMTNSGPFVIGATKVRPRVSAEFRPGEKIGVYLQVYGMTGGSAAYRVERKGAKKPVIEFEEQIGDSVAQSTIERVLPLTDFEPGEYTLRVVVHDSTRGDRLVREAPFTIVRQ